MKRTVSIRKNYEFLRIYKKGKFYVGKFIILYVFNNNTCMNRIGITASKKVGKSVRRNRIRRLIRENYRAYEDYLKEGFDFVFVARNNEIMPAFSDIKKEMKFLFKRLGVFNQEKWECSRIL